MIRKIYYVNVALFALVVGVVALLLTSRYSIPAKPDVTIAETAVENSGPSDTAAKKDTYANLGKAPVFDTLIPRPTPAPTPAPTEPPDPELEKAIASWALTAVLPGGLAMFEDNRTKEEFQINVGEVRAVKYGKWTMDIKLDSTDESKFSATLSYSGKQGKQTKTLSMFD